MQAMGLGDLLDKIRQYYLDRYIATAEQRMANTADVVLEPALRNSDGEVVVEGELQLPLRIDLVVLQNGEAKESLTIDTDGMLSFEPISFDWSDSLQVSLAPFQWQQATLRMPVPRKADWQPLIDWFWHWFGEEDDNAGEELLGAVHFLSDPEVSKKMVTFAIDLGTAPVEAFEELLDAVAMLGVGKCQIGQAK
jgi:hypothetical protein